MGDVCGQGHAGDNSRVGAIPVVEIGNQWICGIIQNSHSYIHVYCAPTKLQDIFIYNWKYTLQPSSSLEQ